MKHTLDFYDHGFRVKRKDSIGKTFIALSSKNSKKFTANID